MCNGEFVIPISEEGTVVSFAGNFQMIVKYSKTSRGYGDLRDRKNERDDLTLGNNCGLYDGSSIPYHEL